MTMLSAPSLATGQSSLHPSQLHPSGLHLPESLQEASLTMPSAPSLATGQSSPHPSQLHLNGLLPPGLPLEASLTAQWVPSLPRETQPPPGLHPSELHPLPLQASPFFKALLVTCAWLCSSIYFEHHQVCAPYLESLSHRCDYILNAKG